MLSAKCVTEVGASRKRTRKTVQNKTRLVELKTLGTRRKWLRGCFLVTLCFTHSGISRPLFFDRSREFIDMTSRHGGFCLEVGYWLQVRRSGQVEGACIMSQLSWHLYALIRSLGRFHRHDFVYWRILSGGRILDAGTAKWQR